MIKGVDLIREEVVQNNNLIVEVFGDAEDDFSKEFMASLYDALKLEDFGVGNKGCVPISSLLACNIANSSD